MSDIVRIGDATLYHGDCLEILPTLGKFDAVITDPPYGISDSPNTFVDRAEGRRGPRGGKVNTWHPPSDWDKSINAKWGAVCDRSDIVAWFGQWRKREEVASFMRHSLRCEIVWAKDTHVGAPCPVAPRDERIWIFSERGIKGCTFETSVWEEPVIPSWLYKAHKNEKPLRLMRRLLSWIGGVSVIDPFMGSGTTGVACSQLGRKFTGIEIERKYFDIACERIERAYAQGQLIPHDPAPQPEQQSMGL